VVSAAASSRHETQDTSEAPALAIWDALTTWGRAMEGRGRRIDSSVVHADRGRRMLVLLLHRISLLLCLDADLLDLPGVVEKRFSNYHRTTPKCPSNASVSIYVYRGRRYIHAKETIRKCRRQPGGMRGRHHPRAWCASAYCFFVGGHVPLPNDFFRNANPTYDQNARNVAINDISEEGHQSKLTGSRSERAI
jgi:hypothetical protein